jgi:hypothetical protein
MAAWFWLNIPACALFFLAIVGVPTWLVLKWPDEQPIPDRRRGARVPSPHADPVRPREMERVR